MGLKTSSCPHLSLPRLVWQLVQRLHHVHAVWKLHLLDIKVWPHAVHRWGIQKAWCCHCVLSCVVQIFSRDLVLVPFPDLLARGLGPRLIISQYTSSHARVECGNEIATESTVNKLRSSHALQRQKGSFSHSRNLDGLFLSQRVGDSRRKLLSRPSGGGSQVSLSDVLEIWQT